MASDHNKAADRESLTHTHGAVGSSRSRRRFWHRFLGKDRRKVSWKESARAILFSSWLNALLIFIPLAWVSHFKEWTHGLTFALCFLSIMPLEKLFDWGGEQLAMYCGEDLGDLIVITLNNAVEATLAIILLVKCELKLLQSTIAGVVLLHLLLVPGTAFLTGGARIWEQQLHPQRSQLNHTLLTVGVLALTIPVAFFAAIDTTNNGTGDAIGPSDGLRRDFLRMSRGFAVILLVIYICSRFYLQNPPGENSVFAPHPDIPPEALRKERELAEAEPEVNPWACLVLLAVTVALMGVTAEFLVDSIEFVRKEANIQEEWFGIVLLPVVSFSADGAVAIVFFVRSALRHFFRMPEPPETLAEGRAIDLSIQFLLFWMPFVTLLGWWVDKPVTMLFDLFEVTLLVGACFLVNYVTADAKTNWAEGSILISYYVMISLSAWYYTGQNEVRIMNACQSIATALVKGVGEEN
ncbi:hypothetical protein B0F90DRAFT_394585 [Multifurca ochricompacta]|uniref:Sodium/calcium exchanger membrane region domain-containing protein n=1 Tax=Multifurca ochricompacta TaxID=376703 RepID=A0AAD4M466_9AGAM|nr:hypothetical protein B0F90DRAFT_394585 [Multifurca ochricompacta]